MNNASILLFSFTTRSVFKKVITGVWYRIGTLHHQSMCKYIIAIVNFYFTNRIVRDKIFKLFMWAVPVLLCGFTKLIDFKSLLFVCLNLLNTLLCVGFVADHATFVSH